MKGNSPFFINLARENKLLCIQETWLWSFEEKTIDNIIPNYESFAKCSDMYDKLSNFQAPRGKGGVAIAWPREWSHLVKRLEEGNERIADRLIVCGDFNATLLPERNNPHDIMFKKFVQENDLVNTVLVPSHTFFSHTGKASSQLDYIFTLNVTNPGQP